MRGAGQTPRTGVWGSIGSTRPAGVESLEASELLAAPGARTHRGSRSLSRLSASGSGALTHSPRRGASDQPT
eukprot:4887010-Pleurochrysis_carterae.AAC.1